MYCIIPINVPGIHCKTPANHQVPANQKFMIANIVRKYAHYYQRRTKGKLHYGLQTFECSKYALCARDLR